jgi:hypothetical protein
METSTLSSLRLSEFGRYPRRDANRKNSFADALKFTGLASERNAVQDQQAYKNGRQ